MELGNSKLINMLSLNTQGFKSNYAYISSLLKTNDIIFLSEHWLSNAEKYLVSNVAKPTHNVYFNSAEKQMKGRPYGGNCFIINKDLSENISIIHEDTNILAVKIMPNQRNILIMGIYMSCFRDNNSIEKYQEQLNTLTNIIDMYIDESEIIIMGDFQTFPETLYDGDNRNNPKRNPLSPRLKNFLTNNQLELVDITSGFGPTYTYQHKTLPNSSYIDHIAILRNTNLNLSSCQIHELHPHNMSDHQPISLSIKNERIPVLKDIIDKDLPKNLIPAYAWQNKKNS